MIAKHNESLEQHKQLSSNAQEIEHLKLVIEKYRRMIFGKEEREAHQRTRTAGASSRRTGDGTSRRRGRQRRDGSCSNRVLATGEQSRSRAGVLYASLFRKIFLAKSSRIFPHTTAAPIAAAAAPVRRGCIRATGTHSGHYKVIRHVRPKFACTGCERVVEAPAPARPIERGLPGPDLLAHVLVSKFGNHLPLYRQSEIFAREGVDLDRSTLAGWVGAASELLAPLVDEIRKHVLAASKIHADDTPVPVLAPGNGKTKTGRLWTYVRDDRPAGYQPLQRCGLLIRKIARANIRAGI